MKKLTTFLSIIFTLNVYSQSSNNVIIQIKNNDTIYTSLYSLPVIEIVSERTFKSKKEKKQYYKFRNDVLKVYPYAIAAKQKLYEYSVLSDTTGGRDKKLIFKEVEHYLIEEYGSEIKKLSVKQGRILIKLLNRETEKLPYNIIKEFRSGATAFIWQGVSRCFGHNLKTKYDPINNPEDAEIENILYSI
tara:strand:- start:726 stop:1292 length:567 start_codon:yes stop_codon:yes gene_type:complete